MAIPAPTINFRAPESTCSKLQDLMLLFERDRSWLLRKAVDVLWTLMFEIHKLEDFFREWKALSSKNSQYRATQLTLHFPTEPGMSFFMKIGNWRDVPVARSEE